MDQECRKIDEATSSGSDRDVLARLLSAVGSGHRPSFQELYLRTSPRLFGVVRRILPGPDEAEEALQEIYLIVWRRAVTFDAARGSAMAWLVTIARNRSIDRLRRRKVQPDSPIELVAEVADDAPIADARIEIADERARLIHCLAQLDGRDQQLLRAAFFDGATYARLAERSATPLPTVKSRIRRALLKLRECLA